jgi:hypothetical protein
MTRRLLLAAAASGVSCGYKLAGRADTLPKTIRTVAVPPFSNATTRYRLTDRLPTAIVREFMARTRYQVVPDPNEADMVLQGTVINVFAYPTVLSAGRAAGIEMIATLGVTLTERASGKVLFTRPALPFKQRYEVSIDPAAYFDESTLAFERLSIDVARSIVSAILEDF